MLIAKTFPITCAFSKGIRAASSFFPFSYKTSSHLLPNLAVMAKLTVSPITVAPIIKGLPLYTFILFKSIVYPFQSFLICPYRHNFDINSYARTFA